MNSVPHREIFLAGYSLTLDNVRTYLKGGTILDGTEEELLPTVYAGGYTNTSIGGNASLTVRNSNDETMFKAIYMGHNQGNDNKKPYNGNAVLNLDAKVTVRENIVTSGNSKAAINISGGANQAAQAKKFYGNENTTLTVDSPLVENAVLDNIGNVVLRNGACLSPETESLCNVTLQSGACLDLNDVYNAVITGDFTGETDAAKEKGILVLNREGCLRINGKITGTTQFQTEHRNTPGILLPDRAYIIADREKATESNFVLTQNSIENGHELKYSDGVWKTAPLILREIGRIEILSAPSEVDLAKISMYDEEKISEGDPYFEVEWYDKEGNIFDDSEVEDNLFYEMNLAEYFEENGYYYFTVSAVGDGVHYTDSDYAVSDIFEYTGESAPALSVPTGLAWKMEMDEQNGLSYYATWSNLDDYEDNDSFNICVYNQDGNYVMNNIWTKEYIVEQGFGGILVRPEFLTKAGGAYRFTVQVLTSRVNQYKSSPMPDPIPEEYFSPWFYP